MGMICYVVNKKNGGYLGCRVVNFLGTYYVIQFNRYLKIENHKKRKICPTHCTDEKKKKFAYYFFLR
jgi:hypothetical protein